MSDIIINMNNNGTVIEIMGSLSTKFGGVEKFIIKLIMENPLRKFYIVYNEKPRSEYYLAELSKVGAEVLIIDTRGLSFITNTYKFLRLLNKVTPDIVHFHFGFSYSVWGPICKLKKVNKLYLTIHGCISSGGKQAFNMCDISFKHRLITQRGHVFKIFDKIFCVSNFVKNQFDSVYNHNGNTEVVYLGTESPRFLSEEETMELKRDLGLIDKFVILTVLFANSIKGCDIFLKSLSMIKHSNVVAIIIGMDEASPLTEELKILANELGVDNLVRWIGITDDVYKYMNLSDVYVQSSRSEALSLAAVEAASFSLPIVATNTGGLPEVTSILFPIEDYIQLARILDGLVDNKDKCSKISESSYWRWDNFFRIEKGIRLYTEVYNKYSDCQ